MKNLLNFFANSSIVILIFLVTLTASCSKEENPVRFKSGAFPDSVLNMGDINSVYDDYNLDLYLLKGSSPIIFSSNRSSSGGQFDLVQGFVVFVFDQKNGYFELSSSIGNDGFVNTLIEKAKTPGNDFGPYRFFSTGDGYEYLILSSENTQGNLDLYYLRNRPKFDNTNPELQGPLPVSIFNSGSDDAYICLDGNQDTAYFCSSRSGNFDIYLQSKPANMDMSTWLIQNPGTPVQVSDLNSAADDKCPQLMNRIIVFTSNRPGGLGGFDLYYSVLKNGKWSSPINFGPGINTSSNEYRPVLGWHEDFINYFLMFSSDRPGGKGGYDLYFTGIEFD